LTEVSLIDGRTFDVVNFDEFTNKKHPYYQNGVRYAVCASCKSSVKIVGGKNNNTQSKRNIKMYASHTSNEITDLDFNEAYRDCFLYLGNRENWQGIYGRNDSENVNAELESYIKENENEIAHELSRLTGIRFYSGEDESPNSLFSQVLSSFKDNSGLYCQYFCPDAVPLLILDRAEPVDFWGYKITDEQIMATIGASNALGGFLHYSQLKPKKSLSLKFVATLDNNENPLYLILKFIWEDDELILKRISAKYE